MTTTRTPDWAHLAEPEAADARDEVTSEAFIDASEQFTLTTTALLDQELNALTTQARKLSDGYWRFNQLMRDEGGAENQGYFGTRVRLVRTTLSLGWFINRFVNDPLNPKKKKVFSTHLKKGNGFRYPKSAFRQAKEWELEAINVVEDQYAVLRQRAQALAKVRRAVSEYAKLTGVSVAEPDPQGEGDEGSED